jgi:hypothetical protein
MVWLQAVDKEGRKQSHRAQFPLPAAEGLHIETAATLSTPHCLILSSFLEIDM